MKLFIFIFFLCTSLFSQNLPEGFVYLNEIDKSIQSDLRYIKDNNFVGKPINGYLRELVIVSLPTAEALHQIQQELLKDKLSLKIFDAYRPQRAVNHFVEWAKDAKDTLKKLEYYPNVNKSELFKRGYIANKSGHSRGSTVDVTIVDLKTGKDLDMGSSFDFFGEISNIFSTKVSKQQMKNRMLLRKIMLKHNFKPYNKEWWHFTLREEKFPYTYFDFPIE